MRTKTGGTLSRAAVFAAEALSMAAAIIHLYVTPEHFEEWWGYGAFFLTAALFQAAYTMVLPRLAARPLFLAAGAAGNLAIVGLWAVTRTWGGPAGPHAGTVEEAGLLDVAATASEAALAAILLGLLLSSLRSGRASRMRPA